MDGWWSNKTPPLSIRLRMPGRIASTWNVSWKSLRQEDERTDCSCADWYGPNWTGAGQEPCIDSLGGTGTFFRLLRRTEKPVARSGRCPGIAEDCGRCYKELEGASAGKTR